MQLNNRSIIISCMAFFILLIVFFPYTNTFQQAGISTLLFFLLKLWLVGALLYVFLTHKKTYNIFLWVVQILVGIKNQLINLTKAQKRILVCFFFILGIFRGYGIANYMLNVDEAWLFQVYGQKNPLYAFAWFPLPSNHVLHTFFASVGSFFIPENPIIGMRTPSVIVGVLTSLLLFVWMNKRKGFNLAFLSIVIFNSLDGVVWSQTAARGYGMQVCFYLLLIIASLELLRKQASNHWPLLFVIVSILGFYTSLSFYITG